MLSKYKVLIAILTVAILLFTGVTYAYLKDYTPLFDNVDVTNIPPIASTLRSNRYTQQDDLTNVSNNPYITLTDHEFLGTDTDTNLSLYVHPEHLSLRIVNESTGYIWGSNMDHTYLDPESPLYNPANPQTNIRQDISPVSISFYNTAQTTLVRQTEYFFDGAFDGSFVRQDFDDKVGFRANIRMPRSGIRFTLSVYLDQNGLNIEVPFSSVQDSGNFLISTITVYRNFGLTTKDLIPGYVFIPDGIGALIRYDESMSKNFSKRFYGPDLTLNTPTLERYLTAGVYGTVQGIGQNAMFTILESGAANGSLIYQSHSPNVIFNKLYATFEYRDKYIQKLNASGTSTIERIQENKNVFDIHYIHKFLEGDDATYVGFSNVYREHLQSKDMNLAPIVQSSSIPLNLDILALENRRTWFGRETFTMTSAQMIDTFTDTLQSQGIEQIYTTIHGWQTNGLSRTSPNYRNIDSKFGDIRQMEKPGVNIFYAMTPRFAHINATSYRSSDIVQNQGSEFMSLDDYYLLNPNRALEILNGHYRHLSQKGITNLSFEDASLIYSDYNEIISRTEMIPILQMYLNVADQSMVSAPFDYLFGADVIKEIELYSSQRMIFTDTVPFLTLILGGHKQVFGRSSNFFANTQNELLRMVDYQVYPNFYITNESAQKLLNTDSNMIFTSRFLDWESEIIRQHQYLNEALSHVIGAHVISRMVLEPGFIKNTYSNGVVIYVNYSGNDYMDGPVSVSALSYEVVL